eukprot:scaffold106411_cov22-Tisochrysis_lutea.AAC.3
MSCSELLQFYCGMLSKSTARAYCARANPAFFCCTCEIKAASQKAALPLPRDFIAALLSRTLPGFKKP